MKRILKMILFAFTVSMLFTGCGESLISNSGEQLFKEFTWDEKQDENKAMWGNSALPEGETLPEKKMPDYYEESQKKKEKEIEENKSLDAFKIKDGHSKNTKDIEDFEIGTMLKDGSFIYSYVTKVGEPPKSGADTRKMVHCAARYNYKTKVLHVFHEKEFERTDETLESFELQMCNYDEAGDIFIYDNGEGYIYNSDLELDFQVNIEDFTRQYFKGESVSVTKAMTDGQKRIYVNVAIEKEAIPEPVDDGKDISEEEADKEAEALDKEIDDKTIEAVLVYEFASFSSNIDQTNLNFDTQVKSWQNMTANGYWTYTPPAETHWNSAVASNPSIWGPAYMGSVRDGDAIFTELVKLTDSRIDGAPLFSWAGDPEFSYRADGYVCSFYPSLIGYADKTYYGRTSFTSNAALSNAFTVRNGCYYEVFGTLGSVPSGTWDSNTISRTYTLRTEYTEKDTNGKDVTKYKYEKKTQTLSKPRRRYITLSNAYFEGYRTLDASYIGAIGTLDGAVLHEVKSDEEGTSTLRWRKGDGSSCDLATIDENFIADILKKDGTAYLSLALEDLTALYKLEYNTDTGFYKLSAEDMLWIQNSSLTNAMKEINEYEGTEIGSQYLEAHEAIAKDENGNVLGENASDLLAGQNLYPVQLTAGNSKLKELQELGYYQEVTDFVGKGVLVTSLSHGLLYSESGFFIHNANAICLDEGTWYGTWKNGDKFVSVGFPASSTSYGTLDVPYAKVMEYDINTLYTTAMDRIIASVKKQKDLPEETLSERTLELLEDWEETKPDTSNIDLIQPEDKKGMLDAWGENVPGEITKQRNKEKESEEE